MQTIVRLRDYNFYPLSSANLTSYAGEVSCRGESTRFHCDLAIALFDFSNTFGSGRTTVIVSPSGRVMLCPDIKIDSVGTPLGGRDP